MSKRSRTNRKKKLKTLKKRMLKRVYRIPQRCRTCLCRTCLGECFMCDKLCEFDKYDHSWLKGISKCASYEKRIYNNGLRGI